MKARKNVNFKELTLTEKAEFLGKNPNGFSVIEEKITEGGVVEVIYTYDGWGFEVVALIAPILDSGYCQIISID